MYRLIFLLALFFSACASPCKSNAVSLHKEIAPVTSNVSLLVTRDTNEQETRLILEATRAHAKAFEKDWGVKIAPTKVFIFRSSSVPCSSDGSRRFSGCYNLRTNRIFVITGYKYTVPSLYHEFVHLMIPGHDVGHKDPRWKDVWIPRGEQITRGLLRDRVGINPFRVYWDQ